MKRKGQAEIMDGLILLLIASITSVVLLSISANYGLLPAQIYEDNYAQKLSQNTLLSLYHITYLNHPVTGVPDYDSRLYKKSIMVGVSQELTEGNVNIGDTDIGRVLKNILDKYRAKLGWDFLFAVTDSYVMIPESIVSTNSDITSEEKFNQYAGSRSCSNAVLTFPPGNDGCHDFGEAGSMCYAIFKVCAWQS